MAIGSTVWPGLAKLAEECGELQQIIGKLMAYPEGDHPDGAGPLVERLQEELADVSGAVNFVVAINDDIDGDKHAHRASAKFGRFLGWHQSELTVQEIAARRVVPQDPNCTCNPMGWNREDDCPIHGGA